MLGGCVAVVVVVVVVVVVLRVRKRAGDCLGGWEPLEVNADVRLSVSGLGYVGSALLDEGFGIWEPLFDLVACAGVELGFYGHGVVMRADGKEHLG